MKLWMKGIIAVALALALLAAAGLAEIADWAMEQTTVSAQDARVANQEAALGAPVNAAVKASDITRKCSVRVSTGDKDRMLDGKVTRGWKYEGAEAWAEIGMPSGVNPGAIRIEWLYDPTGFELVEYGADKVELRRRTQADTFPNIYTMFALLPETRSVRLNMTAPDQVVVNLAVYSEGVLPNSVQTWLPPVQKADMMVFSTHQDDEIIFLGGTIPYSEVVCGRPTVTVYMANCGRDRRREALEALWVMGSRTYPEFINLEDEKVSSINAGLKLWGGKDNILKLMVERIRRFKPEVIVTQAFNGEYGHNQHRIVANAMPYAVDAAADPTQYPESYQKYGAWQVKKLYIHLYKENQIRMDWLTPQPALGGLTLLKVAQMGMQKHASQTQYFAVKDHGTYDNSLFGLYKTTVGADVAKNDFFENIPADASARYLEEAALAEPAQDAAPLADDGAAPASDDAGAEADAFETADAIDAAEDGDVDAMDTLDASEAGVTDAMDAFDAAETDSAGTADALDTSENGDAFDAKEPGDDTAADAFEPTAGETRRERGGSAAPAIALVALGLAAAGGGAWYYLRLRGQRARKARRRHGAKAKAANRRPAQASGGRHARGGQSA